LVFEIMGRFIVDPGQISENSIEIGDAGDLRHLTKVLRVSPGDRVDVSDGAGWDYVTEVERVGRGFVGLRILDRQSFAREPRLRLSLYQGIPRAPKMDSVIRMSAELGVSRFVPVFCARCIIAEGAGMAGRLARWRRIAAEAAKQCGRGRPPEIADAMGFDEAVADMASSEIAIFPYENERERSIKSCLRGLGDGAPPASAAVMIGPEGGFSDTEADRLRAAGAMSASLGRTVLRTETAGPAAVAMVMYELEL
jgi:16S rRNA (uracil1498-N3)-methyltransferase